LLFAVTVLQNFSMNEPFPFRPSDATDPSRGEKFERTLKKVGANPTDILRNLVDAYIRTKGRVQFPVVLTEQDNELGES
jgi:hypothetical protein